MPATDPGYVAALAAARQGLSQGGIPIGAALVAGERIIAAGSNQRVQQGSPILHGEIDCLQRAGRPQPTWARPLTLYTTMSPCYMCAGASLIYGIERMIIGENRTSAHAEWLLAAHGVELDIIDDAETFAMFETWREAHGDLWNEDTYGEGAQPVGGAVTKERH